MRQLLLGAGNMVSALLPEYIKRVSQENFDVFSPSGNSASVFARENGVNQVLEINQKYDVIWLGFKPQSLKEVELVNYLKDDGIIISLLAGTTIETLISHAKSSKVIRIMPNTPSKVGYGLNLIYANFKNDFYRNFLNHFSSCGDYIELSSEDEIDLITPFSGSGPAYIFEFSRIFEQKLSTLGIEKSLARTIMAKTFRGASEMLAREEQTSENLRKNVTSKGGVTFEALKVMSESNLEDIFFRAIDAAIKRTNELKNSTGQ